MRGNTPSIVILALAVSLIACGSEDGGAGAGSCGGNDTAGTIGDADAPDATGNDAKGNDATGNDAKGNDATGSDSSTTSDAVGGQDTGTTPKDAGGGVGCDGLDEAACGKSQGCVNIYGTDPCDAQGIGGKKVWAGCLSSAGGCGQAMTCGTSGGKRLVFPTTCQPKGWTSLGGDINSCCDKGSTDWAACKDTSDCVAFETECCDHCNGGKLMAVHKDHLAAAKAKHGKTAEQCKAVACTAMACGVAVATCEQGTCVAKADPAFGQGCAKLSEPDCQASKQCAPLYAHDVASVCANKPSASKTYGGCIKSDQGCGDALTCAKKQGTLGVFMSTCLGEGWASQSWETCCGK